MTVSTCSIALTAVVAVLWMLAICCAISSVALDV
jgi:hypothetical protein